MNPLDSNQQGFHREGGEVGQQTLTARQDQAGVQNSTFSDGWGMASVWGVVWGFYQPKPACDRL